MVPLAGWQTIEIPRTAPMRSASFLRLYFMEHQRVSQVPRVGAPVNRPGSRAGDVGRPREPSGAWATGPSWSLVAAACPAACQSATAIRERIAESAREAHGGGPG